MGHAFTPTVITQLFSHFYESDWNKTTEMSSSKLGVLVGDIAVSNCFITAGCSTVSFANGEFIKMVNNPPLAKLAGLV